jgi:hypothetical protein
MLQREETMVFQRSWKAAHLALFFAVFMCGAVGHGQLIETRDMTQVPTKGPERYYSPDEASCKSPNVLAALEAGPKELSVSIVSITPSMSKSQLSLVVKVRLKNNTDRNFEIPKQTEPVPPKPSRDGDNIKTYQTAKMAFNLNVIGERSYWPMDTGATFWANFPYPDGLTHVAPNHWIDIDFTTSIDCTRSACEKYAAGVPMELEGEWYEDTISLETTSGGCERGSFQTRDVRTEPIRLEKPRAEQRPTEKTTKK